MHVSRIFCRLSHVVFKLHVENTCYYNTISMQFLIRRKAINRFVPPLALSNLYRPKSLEHYGARTVIGPNDTLLLSRNVEKFLAYFFFDAFH